MVRTRKQGRFIRNERTSQGHVFFCVTKRVLQRGCVFPCCEPCHAGARGADRGHVEVTVALLTRQLEAVYRNVKRLSPRHVQLQHRLEDIDETGA